MLANHPKGLIGAPQDYKVNQESNGFERATDISIHWPEKAPPINAPS
jgi:hypothetical protein